MTRFTNVEEALRHMERPCLNDETKWQALSVVLRELFKASGYDLEHPIDADESVSISVLSGTKKV